jgi:hypothetical protein
MVSIWQQLIKRQITLDEALKLLVSDEGIINLDQLDLDVNRRFRRAIRDDNGLPPVIPLLLHQNCYYLGCHLNLEADVLKKLRDCTEAEIEAIPIAEKSYRDWCYIQELDITRINPNKFLRFLFPKAGTYFVGVDFKPLANYRYQEGDYTLHASLSTQSIPTPAVLPGIVGLMGAIVRKRSRSI